MKHDLKKNASGCTDMTAFEAIVKADKKSKKRGQEYTRFHQLLHEVWAICDKYDFNLEKHIVVKDKKTGRIWK